MEDRPPESGAPLADEIAAGPTDETSPDPTEKIAPGPRAAVGGEFASEASPAGAAGGSEPRLEAASVEPERGPGAASTSTGPSPELLEDDGRREGEIAQPALLTDPQPQVEGSVRGGVDAAVDGEASSPPKRPALPVPRIVALANQKGGVGKTTTALSLAACLAERGRRVLLVDFDPQGGCAIGLGVNPNALDLTVYNLVLQSDVRAEDVVTKTRVPGLDLIPSNIDLAAAELVLVQEVAREQTLRRALQPLKGDYDFVLIDCPPSLGLLTVNALTAADTVLIPLECEYFALRGMAMLMDTLRKVQERLNPELKVEGILATMYDSRTLHGREVLERVREAFGAAVFDTAIPKTIRFAEAPVAGEPITLYAPGSPGANRYRRLAQEVLGE